MPILISSFKPWRDGQRTNSSDQLLGEFLQLHGKDDHIYLLRRLPVLSDKASYTIIQVINRLKPDMVILCGQGKSRRWLKVEYQAQVKGKHIRSRIDVSSFAGLPSVRTSRYAGRFVCNATYFRVLNYLDRHRPSIHCLFVHVPEINSRYWPGITDAFAQLIARILDPYRKHLSRNVKSRITTSATHQA